MLSSPTISPKRSKAMKAKGYFVSVDPDKKFIYFVAHKEREKIPENSEEKLTEGQKLSINKLKIRNLSASLRDKYTH